MEQCRKNKKSFGRTTVNGVEYRFYRTGDEGYIIDGMLHYCGRIDNQVKLHGYRIELEDIESNLLKIHGIIQAVVLPKYRDGKVSSLVAGVVLSEATEDEKTAAESIKTRLCIEYRKQAVEGDLLNIFLAREDEMIIDIRSDSGESFAVMKLFVKGGNARTISTC